VTGRRWWHLKYYILTDDIGYFIIIIFFIDETVGFTQKGIKGWATGAAALGTKGGGHQRGESKKRESAKHNEKRYKFLIIKCSEK
jgi:hypothetical protein